MTFTIDNVEIDSETLICIGKCEYEIDCSYKYCIHCGTEDSTYEDVEKEPTYEKKDIKFKFHHDSYKYNCDQLSKLNSIIDGKAVELPVQTLLKIIKEIPSPFTWKNVFDAYKNNFSSALWLGFGEEIGLFEGEEKWSYNNWKWVSAIFTELPIISKEYEWKDSNKITIWYLLKKIQDLENKDTTWIPIKTSKTAIRKYEKKWKDICDWYGFEHKKLPSHIYIGKTKTGKDRTIKEENAIPPVKWNKLRLINTLKSNISKTIQDERQTQKDIKDLKMKNWWRLSNQI